MGDRHPALAALDVLVGRWAVQPKVEGVGAAWTEFSWQDDGWYLRQVADVDEIPADTPQAWRDNAPFPTVTLIGLDDATDAFTVLYADARGVRRVYQMTFDGRVWRQWRHAPGFHQRFEGTLRADGTAIDAAWEFSADGESWRVDFELTYTRV
jgi:hypothetical protein